MRNVGELYTMQYVINENLFGKFQFNTKNAFLNRYLTIKIALVTSVDYYLIECLYHWKFSLDDLKASTIYPSCETILLKELSQEMNDFNLADALLLKNPSKSFCLLQWGCLPVLKLLSVTLFGDLAESRLRSWKTLPQATNNLSVHFHCIQMRTWI